MKTAAEDYRDEAKRLSDEAVEQASKAEIAMSRSAISGAIGKLRDAMAMWQRVGVAEGMSVATFTDPLSARIVELRRLVPKRP